MRLNVHDFSGHPFQVQLSRELARRGHSVLHEYSSQYVSGRGNLVVGDDDPATLRIEGVHAGRPINKYDAIARMRFEMGYARAWQRRLDTEHFDVVIVCNVPLFALASMRRYFARRGQPWVFWHQDLYSLAVADEIGRKLPTPFAAPLQSWVRRIERKQVRSAARVVAIGDAFVRQYDRWRLDAGHVDVIPNWAPLDELVPGQRDNTWASEHALPAAPIRLLYAGTLGRKHNPLLLLELLDAAKARGVDASLVVCSEGVGADEIKAVGGDRPDLQVFGYQDASRFSEVLASADAVVALLEQDAAAFSVPSKVLSYLAAGRPTIALVPQNNPAAADVRSSGGFVDAPTVEGARNAAQWLARTTASGRDGLAALGRRARQLAEQRFDIDAVGDRFETILHTAVGGPVEVVSPAAGPAVTLVRAAAEEAVA